MLFNWSSKNLCIIFRSWRITGPISFFFSLVAIVILAAGYEAVRSMTRKYETAHAQRLGAFINSVNTGGKCYIFHNMGRIMVQSQDYGGKCVA
jgi:copper transporter 1